MILRYIQVFMFPSTEIRNGFSLYTENCPPLVRDPWKYKINKHNLKEEMS